MLMPELRQHATIATAKERRLCVPDHDQRMAAAKVARIWRGASIDPESVKTKLCFEVVEMPLGIGQRCGPAGIRITLAGTGNQAKPDEVAARQRTWIVDGQICHQWHPVVLDLAIA